MKKFNVRKTTFIKSNNHTEIIMNDILIVLIPFIIFATYKNGILPIIKGYGNLYDVFKVPLYTIISLLVGLFTEYIYYLIINKKKDLYTLTNEHFAIIPGIFLSLIIPINTPIYLLIVGSFIASLSKVLLGGFGKNTFNPALVGSLFITLIFASYTGGYLNSYEVDTISSATPLSNMTASSYVITYDNLVKPYGTLTRFFFGNIPGSIGETSSFLVVIAFIYLLLRKSIKWRIPVTYILTVTLISLYLCFTKDIGLWFILFNILSGGLLFGAVLMATDPVTTPITHKGQILGGIILGTITMGIRYLTPLPEGVLISILILNLLTIIINYLSIIFYNKKIYQILSYIFIILLSIITTYYISLNITNKPLDDTFTIISKDTNDNTTTYIVQGKGYAGKNSIKLKIIFTNDNITNIEILKSNETYTDIIYNNNYLDKIIINQNGLDNLDAVSGCTYTSKYLKEIVEKTKKDYYK